jgi:CheY-like chemotaxis protein
MAIKLTAVDFQNGTTELFAKLNTSLSVLLKAPNNDEHIQQCYEGWHKIKNLAAIFDFTDIIDVAHEMEGLFFPENDNEAAKLTYDEISENIKSLAYLQEIIQKKIEDNTFQIVIPETPDKTAKPPVTNSAVKSTPAEPFNILVIDDEPINTALLENHIKNCLPQDQIEIIAVNSAEEGLYHFFTKKISIIFLDIMMPIIDGHDFIAIVEKNMHVKNITHDFKIMVQTAIQSVSQLTDLAQKESVHEIIRKPITKNRVKECLERYCPLH